MNFRQSPSNGNNPFCLGHPKAEDFVVVLIVVVVVVVVVLNGALVA